MTAAIAVDGVAETPPPLRATRPFAAFEWMVAFRYLRARRAQRSISVIAGFSFLGIVLGVARAAGETAPLLMIGAAATKIPTGMRSKFTALPVEIYNYAKEPNPQFAVIAAGGILLLLALLLTMNATAIIIRNRFGRSTRG